MPRQKRQLPLWSPVHVTNRGNDRRRLFHKAEDYEWFLGQMVRAAARVAVDVFGYNLLPSHFHVLIRQREPGAIPEYTHLISQCLPPQGIHLLRGDGPRVPAAILKSRRDRQWVLHHRPAVHGGKCEARRPRSSRRELEVGQSLGARHARAELLAPSLVRLPEEWADIVNQAQASGELEAIWNPTGRSRSTGRPARCWKGPGPSGPRVRGQAPQDRV
jgi:hypothetical protein